MALALCKTMNSRKPNETIRVAVIAAGVRGSHLARQLASCTPTAQVEAVAEPSDERRRGFAQAHNLADCAQFVSWEALCDSGLAFDAAIVATMDNQHAAPVLACLHRGCHVLVEKPLADTFQDCLLIEKTQRQTDYQNLFERIIRRIRFWKTLLRP
jgi:predicted dehydrogenase